MAAERVRVDPRIVRTRRSVLDAALSELAERGFGGLTIDGIATRSGVARSTIYRLWTDRAAIVADAIEELNVQPARRPPAEESPRARISNLVAHLADAVAHSRVSACMPALIEGAEHDATIRHLHHDYADRRRAALVAAIADAREQGQVRADVDPELAAVALAGAIVYARLMTPTPLAGDDVDRLLDTVLGADTD